MVANSKCRHKESKLDKHTMKWAVLTLNSSRWMGYC
jgi:hypothetical protein